MKDVQNSYDDRQMPIQKVGITDLKYPVVVLDRRNKSQHTVASVSMLVDLPHNYKGTHMSRFVEILNQYRGKISVHEIEDILHAMIKRFASQTAHLEIRFPYFVQKSAPVSRAKSLMDYECAFHASMDTGKKANRLDLIVEVNVPATTLCPCSKEISRHGAHNQRSIITIKIRSNKLVWLEDLIKIAEAQASAALYSLLKREDEKALTEQAYRNPKFAEDIVRAVAVKLRADKRISWYQVETKNMESIHNHNAYAQVTGP